MSFHASPSDDVVGTVWAHAIRLTVKSADCDPLFEFINSATIHKELEQGDFGTGLDIRVPGNNLGVNVPCTDPNDEIVRGGVRARSCPALLDRRLREPEPGLRDRNPCIGGSGTGGAPLNMPIEVREVMSARPVEM